MSMKRNYSYETQNLYLIIFLICIGLMAFISREVKRDMLSNYCASIDAVYAQVDHTDYCYDGEFIEIEWLK